MSDASHHRLSPQHQPYLDRARAGWQQRFGIASRSELEAALVRAFDASDLDRGALERLRVELEQNHVERYGAARLRAEYGDDAKRARARGDSAALVRYVDEWTRRISCRQRRHVARWAVPGLSPEEVRDALSLRLWEVLAADTSTELVYCRAGREWGLEVVVRELRSLRRRFRLGATSVDFWATPLPERSPNQEERWLELEAETCRALARGRALGRLTRAQEAWLDTFEARARDGGFFQSSRSLNLSAASRALGKSRSSALRAYRQLEYEFRRELERFE